MNLIPLWRGSSLFVLLDLVPLPDRKANTITTAIHDIIDQKRIPQDKIFDLGTDGAAVMTDKFTASFATPKYFIYLLHFNLLCLHNLTLFFLFTCLFFYRTPKWSWKTTVTSCHGSLQCTVLDPHLTPICKNTSETTLYMKTFREHLQQLHL